MPDLIVLFIRGNHDDPGYLASLPLDKNGVAQLRPRIWFLPDGFRWTWWDRQWLAAGGATSLDKPWRTEGQTWWSDEELSDETIDRIILDGPTDVVVAHDAPWLPGGFLSVAYRQHLPPWQRASQFVVSEIIRADEHQQRLARLRDGVRPAHWFHGHHHVRYSEMAPLPWRDLRIEGVAHDNRTRMGENFTVVDPIDMTAWPV